MSLLHKTFVVSLCAHFIIMVSFSFFKFSKKDVALQPKMKTALEYFGTKVETPKLGVSTNRVSLTQHVDTQKHVSTNIKETIVTAQDIPQSRDTIYGVSTSTVSAQDVEEETSSLPAHAGNPGKNIQINQRMDYPNKSGNDTEKRLSASADNDTSEKTSLRVSPSLGWRDVAISRAHAMRPYNEISASSNIFSYIDMIKKKIQSARKYPGLARRKEMQGIVEVRFTLLADGQIRNLELINSSGYNLLDNEALKTIERSVPLPCFPKELNQDRLDLRLSIVFSLA